MSVLDLTHGLKQEANRLGFDAIGIAPAVAPPGYERFQDWLRDGYAAGMSYMQKHEQARSHPSLVLEGVRSIVACSIVYGHRDASAANPSQGKIAQYARGADYHDVLWGKLGLLLDWFRSQDPNIQGRAVADTAPLLERDFARLAGLGWTGKNTMLIDRKLGSFTVLGAILVDCELSYDPPHETSHCGTCTRCLDACPTDAFDGAYRLDSNKCISYWTIEHRGSIPDVIAEKLHGWVFGCDICQDVCPWNRKAPEGRDPGLQPRPEWTTPDLIAWIDAEPSELRRKIKGTALSRAKRAGLVRNAALVLGGRRVEEARESLSRLLTDDAPEVVAAARWALDQLNENALGRL